MFYGLFFTETGKIVVDKFDEASKGISLKKLHEFVSVLPDIENDLTRLKLLTNQLRVNASQLNDGLRGVKRQLLQSLTECSQTVDECSKILRDYQIGKLDVNGIDYNQVKNYILRFKINLNN